MPKGIDAVHPLYHKYVKQWTRCRAAVEGQEAIKEGREEFLPKLSGQQEPAYNCYLQRAYFYEATGRTVETFAGMIMRKDPTVSVPASLDDVVKSVGSEGQPLTGIAEDLVSEIITTYRCGLLVDAEPDEGSVPYICLYYAENVINWAYDKTVSMVNGVRNVSKHLTMVVLKEKVEVRNGFDVQQQERYRVLSLDGGKYKVQVFVRNENPNAAGTEDEFLQVGEDVFPTMTGGRAMDFIPFQFGTPSGVTEEIAKSPILGLVNVNISHYMTTADLEHGRHFTALPTAYITGADRKELGDLMIGSAAAWIISEPTAKVGFLEFTGAGLGHLKEGLEHKENQMAVLGARMLREEKKSSEAVDTVREKSNGEGASLSRIAKGAGAALTQALQWVALWMSAQDTKSIVVALNQDFGISKLDGPTLVALLSAFQSNAISWKTYHHNLRGAGFIPDSITEEQELEFIKDGPPVQPIGTLTTPPGDNPPPPAKKVPGKTVPPAKDKVA